MRNAVHVVGRVHSRPLGSDFHRLLHWLCRSESISIARFSGHGVYLKRLVQLTTPPSKLRFANCHIQFSRCYVIHCSLYFSRDILRFDKKSIYNFVRLHNFQAHFYALCSVHCPLLKSRRYAAKIHPFSKKFSYLHNRTP